MARLEGEMGTLEKERDQGTRCGHNLGHLPQQCLCRQPMTLVTNYQAVELNGEFPQPRRLLDFDGGGQRRRGLTRHRTATTGDDRVDG